MGPCISVTNDKKFKQSKSESITSCSSHEKPEVIKPRNSFTCVNNSNLLTEYNNDLNTRRSSFKETFRKKSLIHKSRFCPSSSEELKLCVTTCNIIDESTDVPTNKYRVISKIGEGAFGTVFYAKNIISKAEVAMKKIVKSKDNEIDDLAVSNEIDILKRLDHPNIIKIYEFYNTPSAYYIINEYCGQGELFKQIKTSFSENQLAVLLFQIFNGLNYLHKNGFIHRDLKLENILISNTEIDEETNEKYYWIKLIDFGCAKFFNKNNNERSIVGTSYYMAPEVIKKKYNEKCDIWSAGVILYMLLTGKAPFDGNDDCSIMNAIKQGKCNYEDPYFLKVSPELKDLLPNLLELKINKRLSAEEALNHPWFSKFNGSRLINNLPCKISNKLMDNLANFILQSKFQQLVLTYLCHNMPSTDETKAITKLFLQLNKSNTGLLTKDELLKGLITYMGDFEAKEIIDNLFASLDGDNNGVIEHEEFLRGCIDQKTILNDHLLQYAFKFFDRDNTDVISMDELKSMFCAYDRQSHDIDNICTNIIENNDTNRDGVIDYKDFKTMLTNTFLA